MAEIKGETAGSKLLLVIICIGFLFSVWSIAYCVHIWLDKPEKAKESIIMMGNTIRGPAYQIEPDRINVMAFGAVGDGKTYDDEAYKAALKEVERRGLPLHFPQAQYKLHRIYIPDCEGALIDFNGSTLYLDPCPVLPEDQMILNLLIRGFHIPEVDFKLTNPNGRKHKN